MDGNIFELSFLSELQLTKTVVSDALLFIEGRIPDFPDNSKNDIRLILQELLINSITHGNKNDAKKKVNLHIEIDNDTVIARVTDEGSGFDYARMLTEFGSLDKLIFDHGRGLRLVCSLSDSFSFNSRGNEVIIYKKVRGHEQSNAGRQLDSGNISAVSNTEV